MNLEPAVKTKLEEVNKRTKEAVDSLVALKCAWNVPRPKLTAEFKRRQKFTRGVRHDWQCHSSAEPNPHSLRTVAHTMVHLGFRSLQVKAFRIMVPGGGVEPPRC